MKKLFYILAALFIGLSLTGCGGSKNNEPDSYVSITTGEKTYTFYAGLTPEYQGKAGGNKMGLKEETIEVTFIFASENAGELKGTSDGKAVMLILNGATTGDYPTNEGNVCSYKISDDGLVDLVGTINVTQYDAVNGRIKGTFTSSPGEAQVSGSFNVKRYNDNAVNIL